MIELLTSIGTTVFLNVVQVIAGCILSAALCCFKFFGVRKHKQGLLVEVLLITAASLLGTVLPIGPYGAVPIIFTVLAKGMKEYVAIPLLISNSFFNMLTPFTDLTFTWRTGINRLLFALVAGVLAGVVLKLISIRLTGFLKSSSASDNFIKSMKFSDFTNLIGNYIYITGTFLIIGSALDVLIHREFLVRFTTAIGTNPMTSFIPRFFGSHNVTTPAFMLAMSIVYMFLDMVKLSALFVTLKLKGLLFYVAYFGMWALLLGSTIFIKM